MFTPIAAASRGLLRPRARRLRAQARRSQDVKGVGRRGIPRDRGCGICDRLERVDAAIIAYQDGDPPSRAQHSRRRLQPRHCVRLPQVLKRCMRPLGGEIVLVSLRADLTRRDRVLVRGARALNMVGKAALRRRELEIIVYAGVRRRGEHPIDGTKLTKLRWDLPRVCELDPRARCTGWYGAPQRRQLRHVTTRCSRQPPGERPRLRAEARAEVRESRHTGSERVSRQQMHASRWCRHSRHAEEDASGERPPKYGSGLPNMETRPERGAHTPSSNLATCTPPRD